MLEFAEPDLFEELESLIKTENDELEESTELIENCETTTYEGETRTPYQDAYAGRLAEHIKTFQAIVKVFHRHGINVCKTQVEKILSYNGDKEIQEEIKAETGEKNIYSSFTLRMLLPITDDELDERVNQEHGGYQNSNYKNRDCSLSKQLKDWKKHRESGIRAVAKARRPIATKKEDYFDLEEMYGFIEDLLEKPSQELTEEHAKFLENKAWKYGTFLRSLKHKADRIRDFTSGRRSRDLAREDDEIEELEWMIENHQGRIIRPPK